MHPRTRVAELEFPVVAGVKRLSKSVTGGKCMPTRELELAKVEHPVPVVRGCQLLDHEQLSSQGEIVGAIRITTGRTS